MFRAPLLAILLLAAAVLLAGCNDGKRLQQDVRAALAKNAEITSYRFSGEAEFKLTQSVPDPAGNPLTSRLAAKLSSGKLTWEGAVSTGPYRMELNLRLNPEGETTGYEIPVLVLDKTMYVHIPGLNAPDEYYLIDLEPASGAKGPGGGTQPGLLAEAGPLFSSFLSDFVGALRPGRFSEREGPPGERIIVVTVEPERCGEAAGAWLNAAAAAVNRLELAGHIGPARAEGWRERIAGTDADHYRLEKPLEISLSIDEAGFVRETAFDVAVSSADAAGDGSVWLAKMTGRYDGINEEPPFAMPLPDNVKPFAEILNLLGSAQLEQ